MSIRQQNLEPSHGSIHRITAQQESQREGGRERARERHGGMAREVEMDKTAKGLKTLIDSRSMQRWERLLSLLLSFGIQLLLSSDSLKEIFIRSSVGS